MSCQCQNDVEILWKTFVSTLCNVDSTLFERWTPALYQRCTTLKSNVRFYFIFSVESTLFQRWSTTLKLCWSDADMLAMAYSLQDVDRFLIRPHHLFKYILYRKRVKPTYLQSADNDQKTITYNSNSTSHAKMISMCMYFFIFYFFFRFLSQQFLRSQRNGENVRNGDWRWYLQYDNRIQRKKWNNNNKSELQ